MNKTCQKCHGVGGGITYFCGCVGGVDPRSDAVDQARAGDGAPLRSLVERYRLSGASYRTTYEWIAEAVPGLEFAEFDRLYIILDDPEENDDDND